MLRPSATSIAPALLGFALLGSGGAVALGHATQEVEPVDLTALIATPGVSGYERAVRERVLATLPRGSSPEVDALGNITVSLGSGDPHLLIAAGMDEPGWVISDIDERGYGRLHRQTPAAGTLFDQFLVGQPLVVQTSAGRVVPAVSATPSTHLLGDRERTDAIRTINDLWVDLGADSAEQVGELGVRTMDPVSPRERAQTLAGHRVAGVAAQARGMAAALLAVALRQAAGPPPQGTVTLVWSAEAVSSQRGLQAVARRLEPDRVVLLTGAAGNLAGDRGEIGQMGRGPVLIDDNAAGHAAATAAGVAAQQVAADRLASAGLVARIWDGVPIQRISIPARYVATPVEMVDTGDVNALARLLARIAGLAAPARVATTSTLPPASPELEMDGSFRPLERLIETYGPAGHEHDVRTAVLDMLPPWAEPSVDDAGNVEVSLGSGSHHLVFVAHMDEVGYEVVEIGDDGTVGLRPLGGFLRSVYEASPALIHSRAGPIAAIFAPRAGYLTADSLEPPRGTSRADLGTDSAAATEALGVRVGDAVTVRKRFQRLAGSRGTGRSIDDRVGSTALLLALARIDRAALADRRVTFAWSTEEEVGLVGARTLARRLRPEIVFAIDTFVSSASPVDPQRRANVPLGSGLIARVLDGNHVSGWATVDRLLEIAARRGIPIVPGSTGGGTDAGAFVEWGAVPMPLSWPARYSHSPVEVMDQRDLDHLVEMIVALAEVY